MTQDEIIEVARQAATVNGTIISVGFDGEFLEAFAKLVEDKVTARYMQLFLDPENQPTQFGTATQEYRAAEVAAEREACANLCDEVDKESQSQWPKRFATMIRARGKA